VALLDAASSLWPVFEGDQLLALALAHDLSADSGVGNERLTDRRFVAVGDEQDSLERDRLPRLGIEEFDLELGSDLDAILLSAGLDDCVHGSSGLGSDRDRSRDGHGEAPGRPETRMRSVCRGDDERQSSGEVSR
jgi:hypothetical protein